MGERIDRAKGRAKEALGELTGDEDLRREGELDRAGAKVKGKVERVKEAAEDAVDAGKDKLHEFLDRQRR